MTIWHARPVLYRGGPNWALNPSVLWAWSGITIAAGPAISWFNGMTTSIRLTGVGN